MVEEVPLSPWLIFLSLRFSESFTILLYFYLINKYWGLQTSYYYPVRMLWLILLIVIKDVFLLEILYEISVVIEILLFIFITLLDKVLNGSCLVLEPT